ncbi:HEPN domain-containing protein [Vulcanococcus limneticus Candia 3F8]|uniref:HEPN domain-containing protein n=1 Tax=Vulcanococcus limneticus TaxID=2170428 RepID=UPI0018E35479|nr:HEPN domain-containing protein [Vulcanococcus limneticus]MCP9792734.1 HEPN domain-containing protein [Vulcanococcus limneticus MW73D5]MCP9895218.1 HEPN domain-containing protein [Vulcanococcus limneticus Candia 3F8]MCP9898171.1 HEPN domain-containing protein [Vulcanococcus limneticus Candia 3B3]
MPPEQDAALVLLVALRHEIALVAALDPSFPQESWGFMAQQEVENLLRALIVLADRQAPLCHDLELLEHLARVQLPEELVELQPFAVEARYRPEPTPLPAPREQLLALIRRLRGDVEAAIALAVARAAGGADQA